MSTESARAHLDRLSVMVIVSIFRTTPSTVERVVRLVRLAYFVWMESAQCVVQMIERIPVGAHVSICNTPFFTVGRVVALAFLDNLVSRDSVRVLKVWRSASVNVPTPRQMHVTVVLVAMSVEKAWCVMQVLVSKLAALPVHRIAREAVWTRRRHCFTVVCVEHAVRVDRFVRRGAVDVKMDSIAAMVCVLI